jgi:hypothetical protein
MSAGDGGAGQACATRVGVVVGKLGGEAYQMVKPDPWVEARVEWLLL